MDQTIKNGIETEYSTRVQIALLSFGFGLVENQSRGLYLEEFEPAQILITIDGS